MAESARERIARLREGIKNKKMEAEKARKGEDEAYKLSGSKNVLLSQLSFAGGNIHDSHRLHHMRGVIWCWGCGSYVTELARGLTEECSGNKTRGSQGFISRLTRRLPPRRNMQWPLVEGEGPLEGRVINV